MKRKKASGAQADTAAVKKTSLNLPAELHRLARIRAAEEGTDFRSVVIAALESYLKRR